MNAEEPHSTFALVLTAVCVVIFWGGFFWLIGRSNRRNPDRPTYVPIGLMPVAYFLMQINPVIEYMLYRMNLRRSKRIRAFLKLANDARMRKKPVDGFLPRRPDS